MEPSKEAIAVRITRLNRQILGKVTSGTSKLRKTIDRETLLDALTVLYDECNDDPVKKCDDMVKCFVDKYRSTLADLKRTRVCISDFDVLQTIGRGHFGEVNMVREKQTTDVYAMKVIRKEVAVRRAAGAEDERDVLATATAPWMPRLHYAFQDATNLYLVMELCNGGDLAGLLARRNHPLAERHAAFYVAEVAHALKALHGMGFVHRDVKPGNILLDRCGHVKLADFGSCARLSDGGGTVAVGGTADYVAPELLAAAQCAATHAVCASACRGIVKTAISACDYWSLGVVAFELVTLRRPFSSSDDDSIAKILSNIQKYEREPESELPFEAVPNGPSREWRSLVGGLLQVAPARRYNYLDTLQHAALAHLASHSIRDQAPPWVPCIRGPEDASHFNPAPREMQPPSAAPFRSRPPFAGQLPFVGYSYVSIEDNEDSSGGFSASHDNTAIDLATFKSAEKLAAMRAREIASLQTKLAAAEAAAGAEAERTRRAADAEAERQRARLQAEITALSLQNRRLERQVEVEKEERMALERTNQQLSSGIGERTNAELRAAHATTAEVQAERDALKENVRRLEDKVAELQAECARATAIADTAHAQQRHYKDILVHAQELRHRRLTEINVRAIDTIAKERALRRQTLSGGEAESRESAARIAQAEANLAKEKRSREQAEKRIAAIEAENEAIKHELEELRREYSKSQEVLGERQRHAEASTDQLHEAQTQLAQERARVVALQAQVQSLERGIEEAGRREAALEEQCARTEARLHQRLEAAEARAASALQDDVRHREKVHTLEQLVRQLEREVSALEKRTCPGCEARDAADARHAHSDTESVGDTGHVNTQLTVLKEQLERAEAQLLARADEIAALKQEARNANLARWRKEREYNELSVEAKTTARELKRIEERLTAAVEARKEAEKKASELQKELSNLKPQHERNSRELERTKEQLDKLKKAHETVQAEVDRSRNDIRKLKSELQYSEKRRLHAEEQEELSSRERAQLRDELTEVRAQNNDLIQNNKALQEACTLLEDQLTELEKLADLHEIKSKDLEAEGERMRAELSSCRVKLSEVEQAAAAGVAAASSASQRCDEAREQAHLAACELQLLKEKLQNREIRVSELEQHNAALEGSRSAAEAALGGALRRVRELQEECAALRTRAHHHHAHALHLQASLADAQEEISALREASQAANVWWRTRETKADATLRQQAKLIDFLQAKVEETNRKKCFLSNRLFGRSGRRSNTSPPLRRANRELREEVDRLRSKLSAQTLNGEPGYMATPTRDTLKPKPAINGPPKRSIDVPDGETSEKTLLIIMPDGSRQRMRAAVEEGVLVLTRGDKEVRAMLLDTDAGDLPQNEANRAFTVSLSDGSGGTAAIVCASVAERAGWVSRLVPAPPRPYAPSTLVTLPSLPRAAHLFGDNTFAIGCDDGLHSLRGQITLEIEGSQTESGDEVTAICVAAGRAVVVAGGTLAHTGLTSFTSALRRAPSLHPVLALSAIVLPDALTPQFIKGLAEYVGEGPSLAVACGKRVFLLRYDPAAANFSVVHALRVDRRLHNMLLTSTCLYLAADRPLQVPLPAGAVTPLAPHDPVVAAAVKNASPPRAILLINHQPIELLLCYAECGVFLDENGKRTRNDDAKWSSTVRSWEYARSFLYLVGDEAVTVLHLTEESYRAPPCTCDVSSLASSDSGAASPTSLRLPLRQPALLGAVPTGVLLAAPSPPSPLALSPPAPAPPARHAVLLLDGRAAFRGLGASLDSLSTVRSKRSSLASQASSGGRTSLADDSPHDVSDDSVDVGTGFLADIRNRARQLRKKNQKERFPEAMIKQILTTEVSLQRSAAGHKSPARFSECDTDSSSERVTTDSTARGTDQLCAEMFARQVRFQNTH